MKKPLSFYLGIDGGGTKTAAVVIDAVGEVLGRGESGGANYHHHGITAVRQNLWAAMNAAASEAGLEVGAATAVFWGLAGVDRPIDYEKMEAVAAELLPNVPVKIGNDALVALVGGLNGRRDGVVLIAGTGMIVYGENGAGKTARAGGWGYMLEQGSGYSLAREGIKALLNASEQQRETKLADAFRDRLHLQQLRDVVTWLYAPERTVAEVAGLAPLVLAAAETGDVVAQGVLVEASEALAKSVWAVAKQLGISSSADEKRPFSLVLAGGLLAKNDFYRQLVVQAIRTYLPHVQPQLPLRDAAVGAALLARGQVFPSDGNHGTKLANSCHSEQSLRSEESFPQQLLKDSSEDLGMTNAKHSFWEMLPMSERRHVLTGELDQVTTLAMVGLMHLQDRQAAGSLELILPDIARAIDEIAARLRQEGRLIYVGAGTSGRLGILDASECPPTFNTPPEQVVGIIAGGERAIQHSVEGAEDDAAAGAAALRELGLTARDCVVGIAASGRTPFVVGALQEAKSAAALTIALTCNLPAPIADEADIVLAPLVGPETVTGSTRLKAGTAQKLVLNMLSTGVMVRLGKTYGNLMVDVQTSNAKLQRRAVRIVAAACGVDEGTGTAVLQACGGDVKVAIVSQLSNVSPAIARERLQATGGVILDALKLSATMPKV